MAVFWNGLYENLSSASSSYHVKGTEKECVFCLFHLVAVAHRTGNPSAGNLADWFPVTFDVSKMTADDHKHARANLCDVYHETANGIVHIFCYYYSCYSPHVQPSSVNQTGAFHPFAEQPDLHRPLSGRR